MIVVADTSPLNYLLQVACLENTLPQLYERVILPTESLSELLDAGAPAVVKTWAAALPHWVSVTSPSSHSPKELEELGAGERAAISVALELKIETVLLDDQEARVIAERLFKRRVLGTLGVLRDAHLAGFIDAVAAYHQLRLNTNFYCSAAVEKRFLDALKP